MKQHVVVIGSGFAGLWAAIGAARKRHELGKNDAVDITLVNRDDFHTIRVRLYEDDLTPTRVPLASVLDPVGVQSRIGSVENIEPDGRQVVLKTTNGQVEAVAYDRLVFAAGSQVRYPDVPGIREHTFNVDSYPAAVALQQHLRSLAPASTHPGEFTAIIVGGSFTGLEIATELPHRLKNLHPQAADSGKIHVIVVDHAPFIGASLGSGPREPIEAALRDQGVETRLGVHAAAIDADGIELIDNGKKERIAARTVIWAGGMQANPLAACFPVDRDLLGRLSVDSYLRVNGVPNVFAAGDVARAMVDDTHASVFSCQHARPQGRIAGHNVIADLFGEPMIAYRQEPYVTCLDLGLWGAVFTEGWDRSVRHTGAEAKKIKQTINGIRIYPPSTGNRDDLFEAAAPIIQAPPSVDRPGS